MSLRVKLALSAGLLLALSLGLVTAFTIATLRQQFDNQQQSRVLQLRPLLNAALAVPLVQRDFASVQAILEESLEDPSLMGLRVYDAADRLIASAQRNGTGADANTAGLSEFSASLELAGQKLGSVRFILSRRDLDSSEAEITLHVVMVGSAVLLLFSGLLWFFSGTVTSRLSRLVDASRLLPDGQQSLALPPASNDEVGVLIKAFSAMSAEIQRKVQELRRLNDSLEQQVLERTKDLSLRTDELDHSVRALQTKTYLLNRAPFAMLVLDAGAADFSILDTTDAVSDVFGYATSGLKGQPIEILELPGQRGLMTRQLQASIEAARSMEWESEVVCGDGSARWCRCLAFALGDAPQAGLGVALCLVDIQELWQAREDQRRLAGELQESSKLQTVGLAIAGIAHDLNTPVGIALTAATKMRSVIDSVLAPVENEVVSLAVPVERLYKLRQASDLVAGNLSKAGALVAGLKTTTANATRLEWRKVTLLPLFEALLVTLSPITHRARCAVRLTCPIDLVTYTEPGSLGQVLTNLVVNATVHAFDGRDDREVRIEVSRVERQIEIRLSDNGNGMSAEAASRAFTPFYTTRRELGGSGLGLFSARRVVEDVLGGTIAMQSTLGTGTAFLIVLPIADRPPELESKAKSIGARLPS